MAVIMLPDTFGKADESELGNQEVRALYDKGTSYAVQASGCAVRWSAGDAYIFYSLAERYLRTASKTVISDADGDAMLAAASSPHVFIDLMIVQELRKKSCERAVGMNQKIIELEDTPGAGNENPTDSL